MQQCQRYWSISPVETLQIINCDDVKVKVKQINFYCESYTITAIKMCCTNTIYTHMLENIKNNDELLILYNYIMCLYNTIKLLFEL